MLEDSERYFLLIEPALDETRERPGGLFRVRTKGGKQWMELFVEPDLWKDTPSLMGYLFGEDTGFVEVDADEADGLIAEYPWPGMRQGTSA